MTDRLLHVRRFGGQSGRAPGASVEEVERTVRQHLYGERRMVQLLVPERVLGTCPGLDNTVTPVFSVVSYDCSRGSSLEMVDPDEPPNPRSEGST